MSSGDMLADETPSDSPRTDTAHYTAKVVRWFRAGADLVPKLYRKAPADHYACPLCQRLFPIEALDPATADEDRLTREHVPARSIGGREMVLTCKPCNSEAGSTLDAHAERAEAFRRFFTAEPLRPLAATTYIGGIPNRGVIHSAGGTGFMSIGIPKQNHPDDLATLTDPNRTPLPAGSQYTITFRETFDLRTARLGFLRFAYLAAFACFGYAYVFQTSLDAIRAAIAGADDGALVLPVLSRTEGRAADRAIFIAAEPTWLRNAVVVVIGQTIVVLPPVGELGDPLAEIAARFDRPDELQAKFSAIGAFDWPTGPEHRVDRWAIAGGIGTT